MTQKGRDWRFAALLTLPMCIFFLGYLFNHDQNLQPTGFIQHDNVSYIAYAKQYLDTEKTNILYSNPFNDSDNYEPIYFQTQTLLFAILLWIGIPPGWILIPFTLLCSLVCFRLLIAIYDHLISDKTYRTISIWLFAWGGGLLTISGFFTQLYYGSTKVNSIFFLDPAVGWWGLNFGRSLFFSCEAYYHLLFLTIILCLLQHKWLAALLVSAVLSISHPFTGIELLAIVISWSFAEKIIFRNTKMPWWFPASLIIVLVFHIYYYLFYLNQFDDHRSVNEQYSLNWRLRFFSMIPAYCIVGFLSVLTIWKSRFSLFFKDINNRLFLFWFLIAFAFANHELFIKPMQPLHFTRGYIWTSLFLLGLPGLHLLLRKFSASSLQRTFFGLFVILFLSDNVSWICTYASNKATSASTSYLTKKYKEIFEVLKNHSTTKTLIIGNDALIPYMSTVYTAAYPWLSHPFTTPSVKAKKEALIRFSQSGAIDSLWQGREVIFIFDKRDKAEMTRARSLPFPYTLLAETDSYKIITAQIPKS